MSENSCVLQTHLWRLVGQKAAHKMWIAYTLTIILILLSSSHRLNSAWYNPDINMRIFLFMLRKKWLQKRSDWSRLPLSVSQTGSSRSGWIWMVSSGNSNCALTLNRLSSSINIRWPGKMVSLLTLRYPLNGLQGTGPPQSIFPVLLFCKICPCCQVSLIHFFSPPCDSSCVSSSPTVICLALLCHSPSGWKLLPCLYPCDVSTRDDFRLFVELYTEADVPNLLIKPQISWTMTLHAQISTLAFHLKEWCHRVDNLVISLRLLRENV